MYKLGWKQFLPFIVTVVGIVGTDLLKGIGMGLVVGLFVVDMVYSWEEFQMFGMATSTQDLAVQPIIIGSEVSLILSELCLQPQ